MSRNTPFGSGTALSSVAQRRRTSRDRRRPSMRMRSTSSRMPDLAHHAGIGPRVPHPALHQRTALRAREMQNFGAEVARPAMLAIVPESVRRKPRAADRRWPARRPPSNHLRAASRIAAKPCAASQGPTRRRDRRHERGTGRMNVRLRVERQFAAAAERLLRKRTP